MEHRVREIGIGHLESIVHRPQRCPIGITDTKKPTTRRCVGFEHEKRLSSCSRKVGGIDVGLDKLDDSLPMFQISRENVLRFHSISDVAKSSNTIVIGVPGFD